MSGQKKPKEESSSPASESGKKAQASVTVVEAGEDLGADELANTDVHPRRRSAKGVLRHVFRR